MKEKMKKNNNNINDNNNDDKNNYDNSSSNYNSSNNKHNGKWCKKPCYFSVLKLATFKNSGLTLAQDLQSEGLSWHS